MGESTPGRVVVFGAAGHLGQELIAQLEDLPWAAFELVGVVSEASTRLEFEFRGERVDAVTSTPALRSGDLVFVCTPGSAALEIVRAALQAEAPCIDCTGVMAERAEVPMPVLAAQLHSDAPGLAEAPLLSLPGATTLAWAPLLDALAEDPGIERLVATVLRSAAAHGRRGLVALSEESIALFNQSEEPEQGPAGQGVAFDVIPDRADEIRVAAEIERVFEARFAVDVMSVQVPTFVGEGAVLTIELAQKVDAERLAKRIDAIAGVRLVADGVGSRGLVPIAPGAREPTGPTLRDAAGAEETLLGGLRPDRSLVAPEPAENGDGETSSHRGWRLWLAYDPVRVAARHATRIARQRFPGA